MSGVRFLRFRIRRFLFGKIGCGQDREPSNRWVFTPRNRSRPFVLADWQSNPARCARPLSTVNSQRDGRLRHFPRQHESGQGWVHGANRRELSDGSTDLPPAITWQAIVSAHLVQLQLLVQRHRANAPAGRQVHSFPCESRARNRLPPDWPFLRWRFRKES